MAAASFLLAFAPAAQAHGPCTTCLKPDRAAVNAEVLIDYPTFRAVLNPTRRQLALGPKPNCYGCQLKLWRDRVDGQPPVALGRWRPRRRGAIVSVPDVPPGRYPVALFDGSENGTHYTWSYLTVEAEGQDSGNALALAMAAGTLALGALAGVAWLVRRRSKG